MLWKVSDSHHPAEEVCLKPTWTEWSKNGKAIARREQPDGTLVFSDVDLQGRVKDDLRFPLAIIIAPTRVTDAGSYKIKAKYGNLVNITSEEITLQVSCPMSE